MRSNARGVIVQSPELTGYVDYKQVHLQLLLLLREYVRPCLSVIKITCPRPVCSIVLVNMLGLFQRAGFAVSCNLCSIVAMHID